MSFFSRKRALMLLLTVLTGVLFLPTAGATLQGLQVGVEAPDFRLPTADGELREFAELRGEKLTVILFWATWSSNSEKALVRMQELYGKYRDQGLGVVAVNADGQETGQATVAEIRETAKRLGLEFPLLVDDRLRSFHDYGVIALPTTVVLDAERIIRYEMSGLPLVGTEEMVDFVAATIEGRSETLVAAETGYQPDTKALHFFNMGRNTLKKSKRMAKTAEMWFKKAIAADESFLQPRLSLGSFYLDQQEFDKAAEQFTLAMQQDPDNVVALCESGMLLARDGKTDEAEQLFVKSRLSDEYYIPCYYYLGYIKGKNGALDEALQLFDQALEINRSSYDTFVYMGKMYEDRQEAEQAAGAYRKAIETMAGF